MVYICLRLAKYTRNWRNANTMVLPAICSGRVGDVSGIHIYFIIAMQPDSIYVYNEVFCCIGTRRGARAGAQALGAVLGHTKGQHPTGQICSELEIVHPTCLIP